MFSGFVVIALFSAGALAHDGQSFYSVPVKEPALIPYATFEIPEARLRIRAGFAEMDYKLPPSLSGVKDLHVKMEAFSHGAWGETLHLTGRFGFMDCEVRGNLADCHVVYERKTMPPLTPAGQAKVQNFLEQTFLNEEELAIHQNIFAVFSHEAAGDCKNVPVRRSE